MGFLLYTVLSLAFQLLIATGLSPAGLGRYYQATAVVSIVIVLITGGLTAGLVRYTATLGRDTAMLLARRVMHVELVVALLLTALLWIASPFFADALFEDPSIIIPLRVAALAIPLAVMAHLFSAVARGAGVFRFHFLGEQVSLPMARVVFASGGFLIGFSVELSVGAFGMGFLASAAIGWLGVRSLGLKLFQHGGTLPAGLVGNLLRFSGYRWGVSALQTFLLWADTVILGALTTSAITGTYGISSRIVIAAALGLPAVNFAISPFAARLIEQGERSNLAHLYELASRWTSILSFVPLGVVVAFRREILALLGQEHVAGSVVILILAGGFAFNAACGPVGALLNMSGMNRVVLFDNLATVLLNIGLNLLLIPHLGMIGAAIAWTTSLVLVNTLMLIQTRLRLKIGVLRGAQASTILAFGIVLVAGVAMSALSSVLAGSVVIAGSILAGYLTHTKDERQWLTQLRTARGRLGSSIERKARN